MRTTKRLYLEYCMLQPVEWLKQCADNPSHYMRPIHISLVKIAIRRKENNKFYSK